MQAHIQDSKSALRQRIRQDLKALTDAQRAAASEQARALLTAQARWTQARAVLFFAPLPEEVDVWPLLGEALRAGKRVFLPRFVEALGRYVVCEVRNSDKDIRLGHFGIREPVEHCAEASLKRLDLILAPGVAFDLHGRRLGRGRGFYDQLLADMRGTTCGVAFDQQIVGEIPVEPHDIHLNCILTPTRWIEV